MHIRKFIFLFCFFLLLLASCDKESNTGAASSTGTGGSLARFTIAGNYLYLADYSFIRIFDISNPSSPVEKPQVSINWPIETIFPYKDKLFIGSNNGMFIYSIANPSLPIKLGEALHVRSCDPVVANDTVSYSTLQGNTRCGPAESGLYIYDIKNITAPALKKLLPLSTPFGLGLADSVVFVCRGNNGLSAINVKDPADPKIMYTKTDAYYMDVIPYNDMLICYINTGIVIYDASDLRNIIKLGVVNY